MSQFLTLLEQVIDTKQSTEQKRMVLREGIDSNLDEQREVYDNMIHILDECTVSTKQQLLRHFTSLENSETFDAWGYEFLPRSKG